MKEATPFSCRSPVTTYLEMMANTRRSSSVENGQAVLFLFYANASATMVEGWKWNMGFKAFTCSSKKCLACTPSPPDMSLEMIQRFGKSYCQIEEDLLTEKALNNNKKKHTKVITKELKENKDHDDTKVPHAAQDEDSIDPPEGSMSKKTNK